MIAGISEVEILTLGRLRRWSLGLVDGEGRLTSRFESRAKLRVRAHGGFIGSYSASASVVSTMMARSFGREHCKLRKLCALTEPRDLRSLNPALRDQ